MSSNYLKSKENLVNAIIKYKRNTLNDYVKQHKIKKDKKCYDEYYAELYSVVINDNDDPNILEQTKIKLLDISNGILNNNPYFAIIEFEMFTMSFNHVIYDDIKDKLLNNRINTYTKL
jgi:hypothetical protein